MFVRFSSFMRSIWERNMQQHHQQQQNTTLLPPSTPHIRSKKGRERGSDNFQVLFRLSSHPFFLPILFSVLPTSWSFFPSPVDRFSILFSLRASSDRAAGNGMRKMTFFSSVSTCYSSLFLFLLITSPNPNNSFSLLFCIISIFFLTLKK